MVICSKTACFCKDFTIPAFAEARLLLLKRGPAFAEAGLPLLKLSPKCGANSIQLFRRLGQWVSKRGGGQMKLNYGNKNGV